MLDVTREPPAHASDGGWLKIIEMLGYSFEDRVISMDIDIVPSDVFTFTLTFKDGQTKTITRNGRVSREFLATFGLFGSRALRINIHVPSSGIAVATLDVVCRMPVVDFDWSSLFTEQG